MTRTKLLLGRLAPILFLVGIALVVSACAGGPVGSGGATPSPSQAPLAPAPLKASPFDLLAFLFTPIFQGLFILLVILDKVTGNMLVAIILLTILLVGITTPLTRKQLISTRQTQLLAPEVKEIQRKIKDRQQQTVAIQEFYKQRGVNQFGGCLPTLLTMFLLIPMYTVFSQGLTNHDVSAMLRVGPIDIGQMLGIACSANGPVFDAFQHVTNPCLNPTSFGINWGIPEPFTTGLFLGEFGKGFGISVLAIGSALVQLLSSRQMMPAPDPALADDPNVKVQRQMMYVLPFISLIYGGIVPAGLMLYWIASAFLRIGQQFLVLGFGGVFPLFGWYPEFARNYTPRYHVTVPEPKPGIPGTSDRAAQRARALDRDLSAQSTIRPNRQRSGRRGRRR